MAVYPGAHYEPIGVTPGRGSNGNMHAYLGIVLHCNDAESLDLYSFEKNNLNTGGATSHFQVLKDGTVYQYIDTQYSSWCQSAGNDTYLSIESQGKAGELATDQQITAIAGILRWAHQVHGIALQIANAPGQLGFGWHGMGAPSWGHAVCPGVRKDQRAAMLAAATNSDTQEFDDMTGADIIALFKDATFQTAAFPGKNISVLDALGAAAYAQSAASQITNVVEPALDPKKLAAAIVSQLPPNEAATEPQVEQAIRNVLGTLNEGTS